MTKARRTRKHTHPKHRYPFAIRRSAIAGRGAFATRRIRKGQRIIEYIGEIVTPEEADRRYPDDDANGKGGHHTFLFEIDDKKVIDATFDGNDARYINPSCQPNCEAIDEEGHIYIFAMRNIQPGTELAYDYNYERDESDGPADESVYPCRCGSPKCRGTILEAKPRKKKKTAKGKRRR